MDIIPVTLKDDLHKVEAELVQKQKQEYHLIGSFLRTRGLRLYSFNFKDMTIEEVRVDKQNIVSTSVDRLSKKLVASKRESKEKCMFDTRNIPFEALNIKNAEKRVLKFLRGEIKNLSNLTRIA